MGSFTSSYIQDLFQGVAFSNVEVLNTVLLVIATSVDIELVGRSWKLAPELIREKTLMAIEPMTSRVSKHTSQLLDYGGGT